jgi:hypothetical protein
MVGLYLLGRRQLAEGDAPRAVDHGERRQQRDADPGIRLLPHPSGQAVHGQPQAGGDLGRRGRDRGAGTGKGGGFGHATKYFT